VLGAGVGAEGGAVARALAFLTRATDPGDPEGLTGRPLGTPVGLGLSTAGLGPMEPTGFGATVGMGTTTRSVILGVAMSLARILTFSRFIRCTSFNLDDAVDVDDSERGIRLVPGPALCDRRLCILLRDVDDVDDDVSKRRFT